MGDYERPVSMTVKDWLVKKMSLDMMIAESVIHRVVDHQVNGVRKALEVNDSVEMSGFGKFLFNKKKALRKLNGFNELKGIFEKALEDENLPEKKRFLTEFKLHKLILDIEILKKRL